MSSPERSSSVAHVAHIEAASRRVNERIVPDPEAGWDLGLVDRACECGNAACRSRLELTVAEYEELRQDARRFAVLHEHVIHAAEHVVDRRVRYTVVEKIADAAAIAQAEDPRGSLL